MRHPHRHSRWISRLLVAALIVTAIPLPSFGQEPQSPTPPRPSLTAMIEQAAAKTPLAPAKAQATGASVDRSDLGSPSFFKKPVGIVILATLAAGVGYALYSAQHDRIISPAKAK